MAEVLVLIIKMQSEILPYMYFVSFLLHSSNKLSERCALPRYRLLRRLPKSKAFQWG